MDVERETLVEAGLSVGAVAVFVVALVVVGLVFGSDGIGGAGALAVVGAIVLFVAVMTGVGYWLAHRPSGGE